MITLATNFIGTTAEEILQSTKTIEIIGISSRGIFLKTDMRWNLFISSEQFRGPLTINLTNRSKFHGYAQIKDKGVIEGKKLIFPTVNVEVNTNSAIKWPTSSPHSYTPSIDKDALARTLLYINDTFLNNILDFPQISTSPTNTIDIQILKTLENLKKHDLHQAEISAEKLLGMGIGLTPEGDDFIIGLLFGLFNEQTISNQKHRTMASNLVAKAYQKTNGISANLIECAANGKADERLFDAFHALRNNADNSSQAIQKLLKWGNTSGRMALLGISTALLKEY